jgi:hypothetical protein
MSYDHWRQPNRTQTRTVTAGERQSDGLRALPPFMKQDKRTNGKLDFGSIQKEVQKVRKRIEREHGLEVGDSLPHRSHSHEDVRAESDHEQGRPRQGSERHRNVQGGRPFKRCSGIKKTPGIKRDLRPK